jgi:hypothetical protein
MKLIISIAIALVAFPFAAASKANSVTVSTDSIEYEGHNLTGQSFAINTDFNKKYGSEISFQRFDSYNINDQQGKLNINNELDLTNISIGLYRVIQFHQAYVRIIGGVVHSTVSIHTKLHYQDEFKLFNSDYPLSLKYEQYSSKTALLPMWGASAGYNFNKYFGVFAGYKYQGYDVKSFGFRLGTEF